MQMLEGSVYALAPGSSVRRLCTGARGLAQRKYFHGTPRALALPAQPSKSSAMANARKALPPQCWAEGCTAPPTDVCARCRTAEYCGAPCQRAHWRAHKLCCKELEAAADAAEAAAEAAAATAAALAAGGGCAGADKPPAAASPTPGVYSGLECRVQDYNCALVGCGAVLEESGANTVYNGCRSVVYCDVECQTAHWAQWRRAPG